MLKLNINSNMLEYTIILYFILIASVLACVLAGLSYFFGNKNADVEKLSTYECGFAPFSDSRKQFEVRFFLVGILFIIFDLEISFLFPWCIDLFELNTLGFWSMIIFLFELSFGLIYEWNSGGLDWE